MNNKEQWIWLPEKLYPNDQICSLGYSGIIEEYTVISCIKEYVFDKVNGDIVFTGRMVDVKGVDGFTVDRNNDIYAACWGQGHIAVIDTDEFKIKSYIDVPAGIPASCSFVGNNMDILAITTASYGADISADKNAGHTILLEMKTKGRKPYLFG